MEMPSPSSVVTGTVFGSSVITAANPSRQRNAPPTAAIAPISGSSAASSPPKITTITISVIGSETASACSVSALTCALISRLSSGSPPIFTLAPGISRSSCAEPGRRRRRSRRPARCRRSSRSRSTTTTPPRPSVATRPARAPAYGSTTRPTCGIRATSAAAARIRARTAGSAIGTSSTRPSTRTPYVALSPITSNACDRLEPVAGPAGLEPGEHRPAGHARRRRPARPRPPAPATGAAAQNRPIAPNTPPASPGPRAPACAARRAPGPADRRPRRRPAATRRARPRPARGAGRAAGGTTASTVAGLSGGGGTFGR